MAWLGAGAPLRTIRWLDGTLAAAATFGGETYAIAAGDATWLDLAGDRATRAGVTFVGIETDLNLDYLGWGQVAAAAAAHLKAELILVDEASRPERVAEVAAIADVADAAQLTHVVSLSHDTDAIEAKRVAGATLQTIRVRGSAVLGLRIPGPAIEDYPTPTPTASRRRYELGEIGLDATVLAHRSQPPRANREPRKSVERVAELLAGHVIPGRRGNG
ncbi:MAG TPA: hypothetical protein VGM90_15205 [Kofleriaceae bacterium]|jgi:hypothetical protein